MRISKMEPGLLGVVQANKRLSGYLHGLTRGRPQTPHSWLYEGEEWQVTITRWKRHLRKLENSSNETDRLIYDFELSQESKLGPQGEVPPVREAIQIPSFVEQFDPWNVDDIQLTPLTDILNVKPASLNYRPLTEVIKNMDYRDTLDTNSGMPDFTTRKEVIGSSIALAASGACFDLPAIILFRNYRGKLRSVWMYPMSMNLLEYTATQPIQDLITRSTQYVAPWIGFEYVKKRFTELWKLHPYAFGGDTTAMDAHMKIPQLLAVSEACAPLFRDPTIMQRTLTHVGLIDIIVGPQSIIENQPHGIASGSGWTQLAETIFQICLFHQYINEHNLNMSIEQGMGIGDDYVWFFDEQPNSETIVEFWDRYGLPGKPEKQSNDPNHCMFLQRLFIKGYYSYENKTVLGGVYSTLRALNSLLNPEKWHRKGWNSDMFCVRCYAILENTVDHPLFEEFVKFVVAGQKDLIPFAKKKAKDIDAAQTKARMLPGLNPTYNTEKLTKPLSSYCSIKIARKL